VIVAATHRAIHTAFRIEWPRLVAALARMLGDVGLAEELAQDSLIAALESWPVSGIPEKPGAWLMTTAKRRAINELKRARRKSKKSEDLLVLLEELEARTPQPEAALDEVIADDVLRLIFTACHPALPLEGRVALTLRLLGGLTVEEIARAFLVSEAAVAQRIVRAKRVLAADAIPYEVPSGSELGSRLASVLKVVYLIFNEGYSAMAGEDWIRPALCEEAIRLGKLLSELAPAEGETHALFALMLLHASRFESRVGPDGESIPLHEQDRTRWNASYIERGLAALARSEALGGEAGSYGLQAAIAACHARALTPAETDWPRIAELYHLLARRAPSPIVDLNRAIAVSMAYEPMAGLDVLDECVSGQLDDYPLFFAVRGDLLYKLERFDEAAAAFERAASLTRNARECDSLLRRAADCKTQG
jgi:RNA polymerase sigma-70 factor, ECF subfamily